MDFFGIGGGELILLLFFGGVILGPRRIAQLVREARQLSNQIRDLARNITQELDREIAQLDATERQPAAAQTKPDTPAANGEPAVEELPEAYRRFSEDFPNEALPETPPAPPASPAAESTTPPAQPPAPAPAPARTGPARRPPIRVGAGRMPASIRRINKDN